MWKVAVLLSISLPLVMLIFAGFSVGWTVSIPPYRDPNYNWGSNCMPSRRSSISLQDSVSSPSLLAVLRDMPSNVYVATWTNYIPTVQWFILRSARSITFWLITAIWDAKVVFFFLSFIRVFLPLTLQDLFLVTYAVGYKSHYGFASWNLFPERLKNAVCIVMEQKFSLEGCENSTSRWEIL